MVDGALQRREDTLMVGERVSRLEDERKIAGRQKFTYDDRDMDIASEPRRR
jgi:hypothetical protein